MVSGSMRVMIQYALIISLPFRVGEACLSIQIMKCKCDECGKSFVSNHNTDICESCISKADGGEGEEPSLPPMEQAPDYSINLWE